MLSVLVFAAAVGATTPAPDHSSPQNYVLSRDQSEALRACRAGGLIQAVAERQAMTPEKLTRLPKANLERTVIRRVEGCVVPQIVNYGAGR